MIRVYVPTTVAGIAALAADGILPAEAERLLAAGEDEESEYAAMMAAAEASAALLDGARRRVVVVAELAHADDDIRLRNVVAVHADAEDRAPDADPDEDLAWFATQEIEQLLREAGA